MMMMRMGSSSGGGGCSLSRYDAGKMDRILLRFRPIAPKPSTGGASSSGGSSPESNSTLRSTKSGRGKRRYKNSNEKNPNLSKRRKTASSEAVTLPLLPGIPENGSKQLWLNFKRGAAANNEDDNNTHRQIYYAPDRTVMEPPRVGNETCVTLECLTYTMVEADALGRTDEERMIRLERDTCPAFVSDRFNRVTWSNAAFNEMVDVGNKAWVGMKESAPHAGAFSCRVRVRTARKTLTVPCDVWRMDRGGFAWRLDVNAALSLALC